MFCCILLVKGVKFPIFAIAHPYLCIILCFIWLWRFIKLDQMQFIMSFHLSLLSRLSSKNDIHINKFRISWAWKIQYFYIVQTIWSIYQIPQAFEYLTPKIQKYGLLIDQYWNGKNICDLSDLSNVDTQRSLESFFRHLKIWIIWRSDTLSQFKFSGDLNNEHINNKYVIPLQASKQGVSKFKYWRKNPHTSKCHQFLKYFMLK